MPDSGLFRSTDNGVTWKNIGGPSNFILTRFSVLGCEGETVVACDANGGVWITSDGGDGLLGKGVPSVASIGTGSTDTLRITASVCDSSAALFSINNPRCTSFELRDVRLADSVLLVSSAVTIDHAALPLVFDSGHTERLTFSWKPGVLFSHDTSFVTHITIRYLDMGTDSVFDSTFPTILTVTRPKLAFSLSSTDVTLPTVSSCLSTDTVLTISNTSCAAFSLDSMLARLTIGSAASQFQVVSFDSIIEPHSIGHIRIRFTPNISSNGTSVYGEVNFVTRSATDSIAESIRIIASSFQGTGILSASAASLNAGTRSICGGDTVLTSTITNAGCDSLSVSVMKLSGDADYQLLGSISDTVLAPKQSIALRVHFHPSLKTTRTARLGYHYTSTHGGGVSGDSAFAFVGTGSTGLNTIAQSLSSVDFGSASYCQEFDSVVALHNTGCDTITITDAQMRARGFAIYPAISFPIKLAPDSVLKVRFISLTDTTGHPLSSASTLAVTSDAVNTLAPIAITRSIEYPSHFGLSMSAPQSAHDAAAAQFDLTLNGTIPKSVTAVHFDLTHDNDLLSFVSDTGLKLDRITMNGSTMTQHFTVSQVVTGTVATLTFRAYLAKSDTTGVVLSNLTFDNVGKLPAECLATTNESGSGFKYIYDCGQGLVQDVLRGDAVIIESIQPNPAKSVLSVILKANTADPIQFKLLNVLGEEMATGSMISGTNSLSVSEIPSGTYYLRVSSLGVVRTRQLTIQK